MSTIGQAIVSKDDKKLPNAWSRFKGMHRLINSLIHFNGIHSIFHMKFKITQKIELPTWYAENEKSLETFSNDKNESIVFVSIPILLMGSGNRFRNYESVFFTLFVSIWLKWLLEKKSEWQIKAQENTSELSLFCTINPILPNQNKLH